MSTDGDVAINTDVKSQRFQILAARSLRFCCAAVGTQNRLLNWVSPFASLYKYGSHLSTCKLFHEQFSCAQEGWTGEKQSGN